VLRVTAAHSAAIEFRTAAQEDLAAVEALLVAAGLPTAGVRDCIGDFIVAESGGRLVGAIGVEVHGRYGLLRSAVVARDVQGTGVGRSLVERLIAGASRRGLHALYLLTETAEDWFPRFGFERVSRASVPAELMASEEFRGACCESAAVLRRALQDSSTESGAGGA
jgi:N-acetylglutamate synthase-like GNAT family acetyltransferase